ncbi:MAG: aldehyde dehydrogenase family protein [Caulobacter sp.]|nr:aldehyde dehydrogenase family protein [Caulobacter sp.]
MTQSVSTPYDFTTLAIAGQWRSGSAGTVMNVLDPYSGETVTSFGEAGLADIDAAYQGAAAAQRDWAAALPVQRANVFRRAGEVMQARHDEIIDWLIREAGSTRIKAEIEFGAVLASMLEASTLPSRLEGRILGGDYPFKENRIYRGPVGVVSVISPWNWPMHLSVRSIVPALALGNGVVVKPAGETPITGGLLIARILEEAGLPPGLLAVVSGPVAVIGDYFVQHPASRVISFTGSTKVGQHIGALAVTGPTLKKALLELGGNGPFVVLDDADLDRAVQAAALSKFLHQGQMCIAANRIIVMDAVHDAFVERFTAYAAGLKVGDPKLPDTVIGPIITKKQLTSIEGMVATARQEGARQRLGAPAQGLVLPPHIFDQVTPEMAIGRHEIFGPVAPIYRARDEAHALELANDTEYGLTSAVFSGSIERGAQFAKGVKAGMTHVNDVTAIDMPGLPFGGEKNSGLGRFGAAGVIEAFTTEHWISIQHAAYPYPF